MVFDDEEGRGVYESLAEFGGLVEFESEASFEDVDEYGGPVGSGFSLFDPVFGFHFDGLSGDGHDVGNDVGVSEFEALKHLLDA